MDINFSVDRVLGFEKATEFSFSISPTPLSSVRAIKWSFGDGKESTDFSPKHFYIHEGTYTPYVLVYTDTSMVSAKTSITINPYIEESIYFAFVPPPTFAGHYNRYPFVLHITSKTADPHYIDLSAMFSRSYKHQETDNKWEFLRPEWRFLDIGGNIIDKIQTTDTLIKIDGDGNHSIDGTVVGVSGKAEFYFIDDLYNFDLATDKQQFTTIIATLESDEVPAKDDFIKTETVVPGYANSKTTAFFPYVFQERVPQELKITENGIQAHVNPKWSDIRTPVMVNPVFNSDFPDEWIDGIGTSVLYKPVEFFTKYFPISGSDIPITINVSNLSALFDPYDTKFVYKDDTNYKVSGYYKGEFITDTISALDCIISASATLPLPILSSIYVYPILWVSNPEAKTLNTVQYFQQANLSAASSINLSKAQIYTFDIPVVDSSDYTNLAMAVTGFHGVYSMAVTPFPDYHVWAADSEKNWIYKYATTGQLLCSISLRSIVEKNNLGYLVDQQVSPASMVLDKKKNLWVTLYDTISTLKFDSTGRFLFATTPLETIGYDIPPNIDPLWFQNTQYFYSTNSETGDNNFIEPTGIDSDLDNNRWVSYSYFASGYVIKYDQNGMILNTISFPTCSCPQEIVCDRNNDLWIVVSDIIWGDFGNLQKYNSDGVLLSSFGGIRQPSNATVDPKQNLWFTFDYDKIGKIDIESGSVVVINLSSKEVFPYTPDYWFRKEVNTDDTIFEGIATDYRGNVYVLNSVENQIYILDQETMAYKDRFYVNPQGMEHYIEKPFGPTVEAYHLITKSLQAQGDWSGFRWLNKYINTDLPYGDSPADTFITGQSQSLNYYKENPYPVYKINENFDMANYIKSLSFMPTLANSTYLLDTFLPAIYGKTDPDDLGVKSYEKIANFLINQSDIDTCNIDQLYDLSQMVDMNSDDFQLSYPERIKRLVSLASINESFLWGSLTDKELDIPKMVIESTPIDTTTFMVTAGIPMVLKTKSLGTYRLIQTGEIYGQSTYSIVYLVTSLGLDGRDWRSSYDFYVADAWQNQTYLNNLIDWSNPLNTISPILSTASIDWDTDQGVLETMFSYYLFKGLDFLP